jgi:MarR-like DNA-binding transcriptional regulator SgrR of sgrS sRNA
LIKLEEFISDKKMFSEDYENYSNGYYDNIGLAIPGLPSNEEGEPDFDNFTKEQLIAYIKYYEPLHELTNAMAGSIEGLGVEVQISETTKGESNEINVTMINGEDSCQIILYRSF